MDNQGIPSPELNSTINNLCDQLDIESDNRQLFSYENIFGLHGLHCPISEGDVKLQLISFIISTIFANTIIFVNYFTFLFFFYPFIHRLKIKLMLFPSIGQNTIHLQLTFIVAFTIIKLHCLNVIIQIVKL